MPQSSTVDPLSSYGVKRPCVAILLGAPFNTQNFERTGIPYLSRHAHIVVLDCKPWLGRSAGDLYRQNAWWNPIESIGSPQAMEQALRRHQPDYALDFVGLCTLTPLIQELLAAHGTCFVVQKSGNLPIPTLLSRLFWRIKSHFTRKPPIETLTASAGGIRLPAARAFYVVRRMIALFHTKWLISRGLRAPDIALLAGRSALDQLTRRAHHILWVASQDYHIYQRLPVARPVEPPTERFAVFVDDNLPYASDWSLLKLPAPVTPQRYYPAMQRVLRALERLWGMPILVALHPSSRYDQRVQEGFGARRLVYGRTAELVRDAQAVILHGSTAVSFAVLAQKCMLFLTSGQLARSPYGLHVRTMAETLGRMPIDIDGDEAMPTLHSLSPDPQKLQCYVERYLCSPEVVETYPWQTFIDYMRTQTRHISAGQLGGGRCCGE